MPEPLLEVWRGDRFSSPYTAILDTGSLYNYKFYYEFPRDPVLFLPHHHWFSSEVYRRSILPLLLTATKGWFPLFWKQTQAPSIAIWLKKVAEINEMEDLVATEKGLRENNSQK